MFSLEPRPATVVHVCDDIACRLGAAAAPLLERARPAGDPRRRPCGPSARASACASARRRALSSARARARGLRGRAGHDRRRRSTTYGRPPTEGGASETATTARADGDGRSRLPPSAPQTPRVDARRRDGLRLLARVGPRAIPTSLDDYRAHGGYARSAARSSSAPKRVIREVTDSKLVGRGGAAFPDGPQVGRRRASRRRARTTSSATPTSRSPARSRIAC